MYYIIGDYIRLGNTSQDAKHSTVLDWSGASCVSIGRTVVSMNRCGRKLYLHVWERVEKSTGPDGVEPRGSFAYDGLKRDFLNDEKGKR